MRSTRPRREIQQQQTDERRVKQQRIETKISEDLTSEDVKCSWRGRYELGPVLSTPQLAPADLSRVPPTDELASKGVHSKRKSAIAIIMVTLGIITDPHELYACVPDAGFSAEGIKNSKSRQHRRAKGMYLAISTKIAELLCPSDPNLCQSLLAAGAKNYLISGVAKQNDLKKNVIALSLHGARDVSLVASSLISSSFTIKEASHLIKESTAKALENGSAVPHTRATMGRDRSATLR
jgi:hypothetical protein